MAPGPHLNPDVSLVQAKTEINNGSRIIISGYGTDGQETADKIVNTVKSYNSSHPGANIKVSYAGGKFTLLNSSNLSRNKLKKLLQEHRYAGWYPKVEEQRDKRGNIVITLSADFSSILKFNPDSSIYNLKGPGISLNSSDNRLFWKNPMYTVPNFFKLNPNLYRFRSAKSKKTILELQKSISPKNFRYKLSHYFLLFDEIPRTLVPKGRFNDGLTRDEMFFANAQKSLSEYKNKKGVFFINYTGHQGPVAAALSGLGMPLYWQIDGSRLSDKGERIINQIQDWEKEISSNTQRNDSNFGVILEPNHGGTTIQIENLPTLKYLKECNIKEVVILSEDKYKQPKKTGNVSWPDKNFLKYIKNLERNGIKVAIIGLDNDS